jgi:hypothetical protein
MNLLGVWKRVRIGIKEWFIPQISEHCPVNRPTRLERMRAWLRRPGRASVFTASAGIAHEWMTSDEVIIKRIIVLEGSWRSSEVFIRRR